MYKLIISWGFYFVKQLDFMIRSFKRFHFFFTHRNVKFTGARGLSIGTNSVIGDGSWVNINSPNKGVLKIGNYCSLGMNNFITVGGNIEIGNYFLSGMNCSFITSSHLIDDPRIPYLKSGVTSKNKIKISNNVFIGYGVNIIGNVSIGEGSVIGACSLVTKSIPDFSIAIGNPAKIIKRFCFKKNKWVNIDEYDDNDQFPDLDYSLNKNFYQPLAAFRKNKNVY